MDGNENWGICKTKSLAAWMYIVKDDALTTAAEIGVLLVYFFHKDWVKAHTLTIPVLMLEED